MAEEREHRPGTEGEVKHDRRRAGRSNYSNPALIRMLRGTFETEGTLESEEADRQAARPQDPERDDLAPVRGIALAVVVGTMFWALIGLAAGLILR